MKSFCVPSEFGGLRGEGRSGAFLAMRRADLSLEGSTPEAHHGATFTLTTSVKPPMAAASS